MIGNKVKVSQSVTERFKHLKARTGLTPNILCRLGLCLSLAEDGNLEPVHFRDDGMEFNRYTLLGELDMPLVLLFNQWCVENKIDRDKDASRLLRAHLNRGVMILYGRVRSTPDLAQLVAAVGK